MNSAAPGASQADSPGATHSPLLSVGIVGLLYALATVAITWPVALAPRTMLLGHPGNDTWNHVWGFWWVAQEILENGRWPGWTDLIAWPSGGALYFIDTFNALWSLPVQWLAGPVIAHNVIVAGSLWFSAFCAWLLARHVVRNDAAALIAGVAYGFCPHILAQAHNGITESLNIGWLALYLLGLLALLRHPSLRWGVLTWLALGACGVFNWYYGLFAGLMTVILLLWYARFSPPPWRAFFRYGLMGAAVAAPFAGAALWALKSSMDAPDALVNRNPDFVWNSLLYHNMSDLQCFFRPGRFYSPDLQALYGEELLIVIYVGWALIALAGLGLVKARKQLEPWPWLIIALVFWVFALGPYLYAFGDYVELGGHRIPLPFLAFFEALPLFSRISHPFRFVLGVELGLGIVAAWGLAQLLRGKGPLVGWGAGVAVAGLVLVETWQASPAPLPVATSEAHVPAGYDFIVDDDEPGAVLDLPISFPLLERAVYNWYQVHHGRPIPYTLNEPLPPGLRQNQMARFILDVEASRARLMPRTLPDLELVVSSRVLARQGYRWVVVHNQLYPELKAAHIHDMLNAVLGPPAYEDDELCIYRIP
jgi:hypothetical protein